MRPPAQRGVAAIVMRAAAEQRVEGEQALEIAADVELLGDAHGAVQLHRLFGDEARGSADLGLGARGGASARNRFGVRHQRGPQRDRSRLVALHRHVGEPMPDHLVGRQRPAELLAHPGVFQRPVEQGLHHADRLGTERGQRAVDHGLDFRQGVAAVAEPGIGGEPNVPEIEIAGAAAAEPRKIPQGESGGASRHQEQAQMACRAVVAGDAGGNDELIGRMAVEHRCLVAVEPPAIRRRLRRGLHMRQIEARGAFRMRECEQQRTAGDLGKNRLFLRRMAGFGDQAGADHDGRKIGLRDQAAAERFHQDGSLDRSGAEPAMGLVDRQRQPAERGELSPDLRGKAERIVRGAAALIGVIGLGDEAVDALAQQALLVARVEVHGIYFTTAVLPTDGCRPAGSTTMPNSCRLCAWQS